jgi:hypothetical protein
MKNLAIGPFQVVTLKIKMSYLSAGIYDLDPCLYYTAEYGKLRSEKAKPITITVELSSSEEKTKSTEIFESKFNFTSEAAEKAFDYLVSAFKKDYLMLRLPMEKSGWRTLMEIVRNAHITRFSVYGRSGQGGKASKELADLGLVESRFFLGERGRGGRIRKMRICYGKEPVKRIVENREFSP